MLVKIKGLEIKIDASNMQEVKNHKYRPYSRKEKIYFYKSTWVNGKCKNECLHRIIANCPSGKLVDHINGDTLDNRKSNLRICSNKENLRNSSKHKDNTSGFKGVSYRKDKYKYEAKICVDGKQIKLGYFEEKKQASSAYCEAAKKYYGAFARIE